MSVSTKSSKKSKKVVYSPNVWPGHGVQYGSRAPSRSTRSKLRIASTDTLLASIRKRSGLYWCCHQPFGLSVQSAMGRPRTTGTGKKPKRYTRIAVDYTHKRRLLEFLAAGYSVNEAIGHVYPNCSRLTGQGRCGIVKMSNVCTLDHHHKEDYFPTDSEEDIGYLYKARSRLLCTPTVTKTGHDCETSTKACTANFRICAVCIHRPLVPSWIITGLLCLPLLSKLSIPAALCLLVLPALHDRSACRYRQVLVNRVATLASSFNNSPRNTQVPAAVVTPMRACSILFVAVAVLLYGSGAVAVTSSGQTRVTASYVSRSAAPSARSLSAHDPIGAHQRSLRGRVTEDGNDEDGVQDPEDGNDEDGVQDSEDSGKNEERKGGTELVQWAHGLSDTDAKMVRQIAKGRSAEHTLDKLNVPYNIMNGERVYSIHNPVYARYRAWVKRQRDNPLTFDRR
ncbi:hypothetical protein ON010_g5955 [Phytophthora cinnamomi]|nr:hypothetical protein ON010_g5955 [Phytophthora cinnamomi]